MAGRARAHKHAASADTEKSVVPLLANKDVL